MLTPIWSKERHEFSSAAVVVLVCVVAAGARFKGCQIMTHFKANVSHMGSLRDIFVTNLTEKRKGFYPFLDILYVVLPEPVSGGPKNKIRPWDYYNNARRMYLSFGRWLIPAVRDRGKISLREHPSTYAGFNLSCRAPADISNVHEECVMSSFIYPRRNGGTRGPAHPSPLLQPKLLDCSSKRFLGSLVSAVNLPLGQEQLGVGAFRGKFRSIGSLFVRLIHLNRVGGVTYQSRKPTHFQQWFSLVPPVLFRLASNLVACLGWLRLRPARWKRDIWLGVVMWYAGFPAGVWNWLILMDRLRW